MFSPFEFLIQRFYICLYYCPKMDFICEFQHTPLQKIIGSSIFHTSSRYEILRTRLTWKQEYGEAHYISNLKNDFFALKTLLSLYGAGGKNYSINFERYDLANSEE